MHLDNRLQVVASANLIHVKNVGIYRQQMSATRMSLPVWWMWVVYWLLKYHHSFDYMCANTTHNNCVCTVIGCYD